LILHYRRLAADCIWLRYDTTEEFNVDSKSWVWSA